MIATLRIQTPRKDERESLDCFPEFIFRFYENLDINPTSTGRMVFFFQERHILSNKNIQNADGVKSSSSQTGGVLDLV